MTEIQTDALDDFKDLLGNGLGSPWELGSWVYLKLVAKRCEEVFL